MKEILTQTKEFMRKMFAAAIPATITAATAFIIMTLVASFAMFGVPTPYAFELIRMVTGIIFVIIFLIFAYNL